MVGSAIVVSGLVWQRLEVGGVESIVVEGTEFLGWRLAIESVITPLSNGLRHPPRHMPSHQIQQQ